MTRDTHGFIHPRILLPTLTSPHGAQRPLIFTLSTNTPTTSLMSLLTRLSLPSTASSVGYLSAAVHPATHLTAPIACTLALFQKGDTMTFWSEIAVQQEAQVGKWHAIRKRVRKGGRTHGRHPDNTSQGLNLAFSSSLTDGTKVGTRHRQPKQVLFASSTPFVTGRQYMLIFNGCVTLSGAIGLALSGGPHMASTP